MSNELKCFSCGHPIPEDLKEHCFRCCSIGAATMPYCILCSSIGAESTDLVKGLIGDPENCHESVVVYDSSTDWYRYYRDGETLPCVKIDMPNGGICPTRAIFNEKLAQIQERPIVINFNTD